MKIQFTVLLVMIFVVAGAIEENRVNNLCGAIMLAIGIGGVVLSMKIMEMKGR